jgi:hypothetical protein
MARYAALYGSQSEADAALEYISRLPFYKELDIQVIDNTNSAEGAAVVVPIVQNTGSYTGNMPGVAIPALVDLGLKDEDHRFFADGVRNGGVLVVAETDDDERAALVRRALRESGGRTARED